MERFSTKFSFKRRFSNAASTLSDSASSVNFFSGDTSVTLDSQQTDIHVNDIVLLARDSEPIPFRVLAVDHLAESQIRRGAGLQRMLCSPSSSRRN